MRDNGCGVQTYLTGVVQQLLDRDVRRILLKLTRAAESIVHSAAVGAVFLEPVFEVAVRRKLDDDTRRSCV